MKNVRDLLLVLTSISVIVFILDFMTSKYNLDQTELTCINPDVENTLLEVTTEELKKKLNTNGFELKVNVIREDTSTEHKESTYHGQNKYKCNTNIKLTIIPTTEKSKYWLKKTYNKNEYVVDVERDYEIIPNDLGTQYWIYSKRINYNDIWK